MVAKARQIRKPPRRAACKLCVRSLAVRPQWDHCSWHGRLPAAAEGAPIHPSCSVLMLNLKEPVRAPGEVLVANCAAKQMSIHTRRVNTHSFPAAANAHATLTRALAPPLPTHCEGRGTLAPARRAGARGSGPTRPCLQHRAGATEQGAGEGVANRGCVWGPLALAKQNPLTNAHGDGGVGDDLRVDGEGGV